MISQSQQPPPERTGGALEGITVIELCGARGHFMAKLMGDMGARVIKIEPLGGASERQIGPFMDDDPHPDRSLFFWAHNTSKESLELNIETPEGQKIIKRLAAIADVILEDFEPGYLPSLGLGYKNLSAGNERLVMTSLTAFGQDGPYRDYKSTDIVALAMGGIMHSCGYDDLPGSPPIRPSGDHGDKIASHYGLMGTLAAIFNRHFSGKGQYIDASAHEACNSTTEHALPTYLYEGENVFRQTGRHHSTTPTPKTLCKTSDGKYLIVFQLFNNLHSWLSLVRWMADAGMAEDLQEERYKDMARGGSRGMRAAKDTTDSDHAFEVVRRFIASQTSEGIYRGAQNLKFPWGQVRSPEENLHDPHFAEDRQMFANIHHPEMGEGVSFKYVGRPYRFTESPWDAFRPPLVGEHTKSILSVDLQYSEQDLKTLEVNGIISSNQN